MCKRITNENDVIKSIEDANIDANSFTSTLNENQLPTIVEGQSSNPASQKKSIARDRNAEAACDSEAVATAMDASHINCTLISDSTLAAAPCNLATFLIQRACRNPTLSNYLYWYLYIECESQDALQQQDETVKSMYEKVLRTFKKTLQTTAELRTIKTNLEKQQLFIDELVKLVKIVAKESGNRKKKCEKFQQLLAENDAFRINFSNLDPIPLPLDPDVYIRGIIPAKVSLFKSALMPSKYGVFI